MSKLTPVDLRYAEALPRFLSKVIERNGCMEWTASKNQFGHGMFRLVNGTTSTTPAHRASYQIFVGPIPPGMCVRHKCHNPSCVDPAHLEVGTHADNMQDMIRAGRAGWQRGLPAKQQSLDTLMDWSAP